MEDRRKRILYRAMHRGFKEADIILGSFAEDHLPAMTDAEVEQFERLLDAPDQELYGWIIGRDTPPDNYQCDVLTQLQKYGVAEAMVSRLS